jgi:hypothetical protein
MSNLYISYFNGEIAFWDELPRSGDLPLHALLYRYEPKKFDGRPLLYRVHITFTDIPTYRPIKLPWIGLPFELKAAALLMGAPIPE